MRTRIVIALLLMSAVLLSGCSAPDPFDSNELCKYYRVTSGDAADGESAPYPLDLKADQKLSISYVAQIKEGSAEFQLLTDLSDVTWRTPVMPTTETKTLDVDSKIDGGKFNMIVSLKGAKNFKICWKVDIK